MQTLTSSDDTHDLFKDYAEIGIDAVLDEGILKDIPVVGTIISLAKVGISVSDRLLIAKILKFVRSVKDLPTEIRAEMVNRLESDPTYGRKVGEHLTEILERVEAYRKPTMIAVVFKAYAKGEIDANMLHRLTYAIDRIPSYDIGEVRRFQQMSLEDRGGAKLATKQALLIAGLLNVGSGFGNLIYQPNDVCEAFLALDLDRVEI